MCYCHLARPSSLPVPTDLHLFKEGIRPLWEVPFLLYLIHILYVLCARARVCVGHLSDVFFIGLVQCIIIVSFFRILLTAMVVSGLFDSKRLSQAVFGRTWYVKLCSSQEISCQYFLFICLCVCVCICWFVPERFLTKLCLFVVWVIARYSTV